jgi:hypothetical protein
MLEADRPALARARARALKRTRARLIRALSQYGRFIDIFAPERPG